MGKQKATTLVSRVAVMAIDLTTRRHARLRQDGSGTAVRTVVDNVPGLVASLDRFCRVEYCNAAYETWFGVAASHFIGHTLDEVVGQAISKPQDPEVRRALAGERSEVEFDIERQGERRTVQATYLPHFDADGSVAGVHTLGSDITSLKRLQKQLTQLASYDALTGLPNRAEFNSRLQESLLRADRTARPLALMFIDIDHFKTVNDRYGHAAGDEVLQEVATRLQGSVRKSDLAFRLGGDEFVVLLEDVRTTFEAHFVACKILAAINHAIIHGDLSLRIGVSIGIGFHTHPDSPASDLLGKADLALYEAKKGGRNTCRFYDEDRVPASMMRAPVRL